MAIHWCLGFVELVFVMFDFPPLVAVGLIRHHGERMKLCCI